MKGVSIETTYQILRAYARGVDLRAISDEFRIDAVQLHKLMIETCGPGMQRQRAREIIRTAGLNPRAPVTVAGAAKPARATGGSLTARQVEIGQTMLAGGIAHDPDHDLREHVDAARATPPVDTPPAAGPIPTADWPEPDQPAVNAPRPPMEIDHNPPRDLVDAYMADVLLRHRTRRAPKLAVSGRQHPAPVDGAGVAWPWTWQPTDGVILAEYGAYQCAPCHYTGPAAGHTARATCPQLRPVRVVILAQAEQPASEPAAVPA